MKETKSILAYMRTLNEATKAIIVCNLSDNTVDWPFLKKPRGLFKRGIIIIGNYTNTAVLGVSHVLQPFESLSVIQTLKIG